MDDLKIKLLVEYPNQPSEADLQFELYYRLQSLGYDTKAEVKLRTRDTFDTCEVRGARFDLVVFDSAEAKVIIEVKKRNNAKAGKQQAHYTNLTGLPVLVCAGPDQIAPTIIAVQHIMDVAPAQH